MNEYIAKIYMNIICNIFSGRFDVYLQVIQAILKFPYLITPIQEVFHVYLNKFENAVTNLFLAIFGNNWFQWVSLISRNTQPSKKQFLIFIFWFETVSEGE